MAKVTSIVCDRHPEVVSGVENISFGAEGTLYEMDLCSKCRNDFLAVMSRWQANARKVQGTFGPKTVDPALAERKRAVRAWAVEAGLLPLGQAGVIAKKIYEAYDEAHPASEPADSGDADETAVGPSAAPVDGPSVNGRKPYSRRTYTDEEKRKAVAVLNKKGAKAANIELNISPTVLRDWRTKMAEGKL